MKKIIMIVVVIVIAAAVYLLWPKSESGINKLYGNVDIRSVNTSFRVGGRLIESLVDEGDTVKEGDILARIDLTPYQIARSKAVANLAASKAQLDLMLSGYRTEEIDQAKAQVEQYKAAYQYADSTYQRQVALAKTEAISKDQLDNTRAARDQAKAALQTAEDKLTQYLNGNREEDIEAAKANVDLAAAELAQAELNLSDTTLYSPANGTILTRIVEPGTLLSAGSYVYSISLTSPVWIRAYVDEVNLAYAKPGQEVLVYTDAKPDKPYKGQIGFVSPTAEFTPKSVETEVLRTSLVYRLRIIVTDSDDMLRQGMPVTIKFAE
nr:secretion protein HlyD [Zophobihabitans entericus]